MSPVFNDRTCTLCGHEIANPAAEGYSRAVLLRSGKLYHLMNHHPGAWTRAREFELPAEHGVTEMLATSCDQPGCRWTAWTSQNPEFETATDAFRRLGAIREGHDAAQHPQLWKERYASG
jgi:hypothetical protein